MMARDKKSDQGQISDLNHWSVSMNPKLSKACTLFVLTLSLCFQVNSFNFNIITSVTEDVITKYSSVCVYLMYPKHHQVSYHLAKMKKSLSHKGVFVAARFIDREPEYLYSTRNRPFHVVVSSDIHTKYALSQISKTSDLSSGTWLLFMDTKTSLEEFFADIHIPFDSDFLVAQHSSGVSEENYEVSLTEVYRVRDTLPLQHLRIANWSSVSGLSWTTLQIQQRRDLQGIAIRCVFIPEPPYLSVGGYHGKDPVYVNGYSVELMKVLQYRMNYTTNYYIPDEISYGTEDENRSWNGMVGEVVKRRADVGLNLFMLTTKRAGAVDFFPPIFNTKMMVHVRMPGIDHSSFRQLVSQFAPLLWVTAIITMVILTLFLSATWYAAVRYNYHREVVSYRLHESWMYTVGIICQQAHHVTPRSWPCRLVYLTVYVTALVLFAAYSAIFISFLAVRRFHLPFTDFQGLLQDGTYVLGVIKNSERESYFKKADIPVLKQIYKSLIEPYRSDPPLRDEDGLTRVCKEQTYSYICTQVTVQGLARTLPCNLVEIPQAYFSVTVSMIIQKSSPFKRLFSHRLQELKRSGLVDRINKQIWPEDTDDAVQQARPSVTLGTTGIFFVILSAGVVLSVLVLLAEIWWQKQCPVRRRTSRED